MRLILRTDRQQQNKQAQQGFTLVELLVVIGIIGILMAITIVAINPVQQFQNARNSSRQSDVTSILDAIYQYEAQNTGTIPGTLGSITAGTPYSLASSGANFVDLCQITSGSAILVPTYIADLPSDPSQSSPKTPASTNCRSTTAYNTGYTITRSATGNRFTVNAPLAENSVTISVTR
jgi:prepilin-type N-terminal cleavage/methylation domain-containing protein